MPRFILPGQPTEKQREAWEAVERLGSQIAAAKELGISQGGLQSRMRGYQRAMGIVGDLPGMLEPVRHYSTRGTGQVAQLRQRVRELEAELGQQQAVNSALLQRIAELELLAHPWAAVHQKLDVILARSTAPAVPAVITHRRRADGGVGGKTEAKARRVA